MPADQSFRSPLRALEHARQRWSTRMKLGLVFIALAGCLVLVLIAVLWRNPGYRLLYDNLPPATLEALADWLERNGVDYRIGAQGSAVYLPAELLPQTRMALAAVQLPGWSGNDAGVMDHAEPIRAEAVRQGQWSLNVQDALEHRLEGKGQVVVDALLGPGQALVKVKADLAPDSTETISELFDPEEPVVRSEQIERRRSPAPGNSVESSGYPEEFPSAETLSKVDYEISKITRKTVTEAGSVEKLSVTVLVAGVQNPDLGLSGPLSPLTAEQHDSIETLVSAALSLQPERGDTLVLASVPALSTTSSSGGTLPGWLQNLTGVLPIGKIGLTLLLTLLAYFLVIRPVISVLRREIEIHRTDLNDRDPEDDQQQPSRAFMPEEPELESLSSEITSNPTGAAHILRKWIQEA